MTIRGIIERGSLAAFKYRAPHQTSVSYPSREDIVRSLWFRGITLVGAIAMALAMLTINYAFEVAGSIPDTEPLGFLAANLVALLALYPIAAILVAARAVLPLAHRFPDSGNALPACGMRIGLYGSCLYFLIGAGAAITAYGIGAIRPTTWTLLACYTLLAAAGGRIGALIGLDKARHLAWTDNQGQA